MSIVRLTLSILLVLGLWSCAERSVPGRSGTVALKVFGPEDSADDPYNQLIKLGLSVSRESAEIYKTEVEFSSGDFQGGPLLLDPLEFQLEQAKWNNLEISLEGWKLGPGAVPILFSRGHSARFQIQDGQETEVGIYFSPVGRISSPGNLVTARWGHTASLLPDGRVLFVGGASAGTLSAPTGLIEKAEVYDPNTGAMTELESLPGKRVYHSATVLSDGRVFIMGGLDGAEVNASAVVFQPSDNVFHELPLTGEGGVARAWHTSTLLPEGFYSGNQVLLVGGAQSIADILGLASSVRVDVDTGRVYSLEKEISVQRFQHSAVSTGNTLGEIVVIGGRGEDGKALDSIEIYSSADDGFRSPVGGPNIRTKLLQPCFALTPTQLKDGNIFILNGETEQSGQPATLRSAEVFSNELFSLAEAGDSLPGVAREYHTATALLDGRVLIVGGLLWEGGRLKPLDGVEAFSAADIDATSRYEGTFVLLEQKLKIARGLHTATLLPGGTVLVAGGLAMAGGLAADSASDAVEVYNP